MHTSAPGETWRANLRLLRKPRKLFLRLKTKNMKCRGGVANAKCECAAKIVFSNFNNLLQIFVSNYVSNEKNLNTSDHLSSGVWQRMYKDGRAI